MMWGIQIYYFNLEYAGEIVTGNWDQTTRFISETGKYRAIKNHFLNDIPWNETEFYRYLESKLETEGTSDGVESISQLEARYARIDDIYRKIINNGYKMQQELGTSGNWYDEVCVSIGRDGQFIFNGSGWHRLSIAKILELDMIPVRVILRHKIWQDKKEQFLKDQDQIDEFDDLHPDVRHVV